MTRKRRRLLAVSGGMAMLGIAATLVFWALGDNLVFFYSPTDVLTKHATPGRQIRLGGLIARGSVVHAGGSKVTFAVTDGNNSVPVTYQGELPDLFREGQGVVVEGALDQHGTLDASTVLAKHDERYMPPEVVEALKKAGRWQEGAK